MATYIRLTDYKSSDEKEQEFFNSENRYEAKQEDFSKIPASPIAYWVSDKVINILNENDSLLKIAKPRKDMVTLNDEHFIKGFYEDHIKRYKKRPICWMVASPKKGFMSLIYMHRYEADTFARVRKFRDILDPIMGLCK